MNILFVTFIVLSTLSLLPSLFSTKCPKCNKKCKESYYLPGCTDSFYYECDEHGNIDMLEKEFQPGKPKA